MKVTNNIRALSGIAITGPEPCIYELKNTVQPNGVRMEATDGYVAAVIIPMEPEEVSFLGDPVEKFPNLYDLNPGGAAAAVAYLDLAVLKRVVEFLETFHDIDVDEDEDGVPKIDNTGPHGVAIELRGEREQVIIYSMNRLGDRCQVFAMPIALLGEPFETGQSDFEERNET